MSMLSDFLDIRKQSKEHFKGLKIEKEEQICQQWMNQCPTIFFSMKDVDGLDFESAYQRLQALIANLCKEHTYLLESDEIDPDDKEIFLHLKAGNGNQSETTLAFATLMRMMHKYYKRKVIFLLDEYDVPIAKASDHGYYDQMLDIVKGMMSSSLKDNTDLNIAVITGCLKVAKESIFSQFNNVRVYTVLHRQYASYFGFTSSETEKLLKDFSLSLNQKVKSKYDGYLFGGIEIYNPWSLLNYADSGELHGYWVNTSSNYLIKRTLSEADKNFWTDFDRLASGNQIPVWLTLETSYIERGSTYSLWGLLVNSGYLTALERLDENTVIVRIPNDEVMSEFQVLITELGGMDGLELQQMFSCLLHRDTDRFLELYRKIVISCTSYLDAKENAYHMLFLGMCMTMRGSYKVTSNLENGYGRSDITLESLHRKNPHVIIEFKQGTDLERLKNEALEQILEKKYYAPLKGEILCIGLAHDKKRCELACQRLLVPE